VLNDLVNLAFALSNLLTISTTLLGVKWNWWVGGVFDHSETSAGLHMTELDAQDGSSF